MIFIKVVCNKHEILLVKDAKTNHEVELVCYNREFVITVIIITKFDYSKIGKEPGCKSCQAQYVLGT